MGDPQKPTEDTPYKSDESAQRRIESQYNCLRGRTLMDETTKAIIRRKELLFSINAIPDLDDGKIAKYVHEIFQNAYFLFPARRRKRREETREEVDAQSLTRRAEITAMRSIPAGDWQKPESAFHYQYLAKGNLIRLLGYAGITVPSILNDWSIDRSEQETGRLLGITSLRDVQDVLARKYGNPDAD